MSNRLLLVEITPSQAKELRHYLQVTYKALELVRSKKRQEREIAWHMLNNMASGLAFFIIDNRPAKGYVNG